jgi:hypothetical protein
MDHNDHDGIFRMPHTRNGKKIRRPDDRPWKIVLRESRKR